MKIQIINWRAEPGRPKSFFKYFNWRDTSFNFFLNYSIEILGIEFRVWKKRERQNRARAKYFKYIEARAKARKQ